MMKFDLGSPVTLQLVLREGEMSVLMDRLVRRSRSALVSGFLPAELVMKGPGRMMYITVSAFHGLTKIL